MTAPGSALPAGPPRRWPLAATSIFLLIAYGFIQADRSFFDPDAFYHAKMALLISEGGPVRSFPWLPHTTLADAFADHHLLYHIALIPFISIFGPLAGVKVAAALFAASAVGLFHLLLVSCGVRLAAAHAVVLGTTGAFALRLNLVKATSLSLCALMAAIILIEKRRPLALFALSWLFVWLYGGWPLMLLVGAILLGSAWLLKEPSSTGGGAEGRCALAIAGGLAAGLVINPYFPQNLAFYWEQVVQIALRGYGGRIEVGTEWYPYPPARLILECGGVFLALGLTVLAGLYGAVSRKREESGDGRAPDRALLASSLLLAVLFLALTIRSRRNVEYFAPFAMLFAALLLTRILRGLPAGSLGRDLRASFGRMAFVPILVAGYLAGLFLFFAGRDLLAVRAAYREGVPWTRLEGVSTWLARNRPAGSTVFHTTWDQFPPLFYYDASKRYIGGLDPTFSYRKDAERFGLWRAIAVGDVREDLAAVIYGGFGATTVLLDSEDRALRSLLERDPAFRRVYGDGEAALFEIESKVRTER